MCMYILKALIQRYEQTKYISGEPEKGIFLKNLPLFSWPDQILTMSQALFNLPTFKNTYDYSSSQSKNPPHRANSLPGHWTICQGRGPGKGMGIKGDFIQTYKSIPADICI